MLLLCRQVDAVLGFENIALASVTSFCFVLPLSGMEMSLWQRLSTEIGWQGLPLLILLIAVLFLAACNGLCLQQQQFTPPLLLDALQRELRDNGWHHTLSQARNDDSVLARLLCLLLPLFSSQPRELSSEHHPRSMETMLHAFWDQEQGPHLLRCRGLRLCAELAPVVALLCLLNPFAFEMPSGNHTLLDELQKNLVNQSRPYLFWSCAIALTALALAHFFEHRLRQLVAETQAQALALLHQGTSATTSPLTPKWQKNHSVLPWLMLVTCAIWPHWIPRSAPCLPTSDQPCFVLDRHGSWHPTSGHDQHPSVLMLQTPHPPPTIDLLIATSPKNVGPKASLDALLQQARLLGWRVDESPMDPFPPRAFSP